VSIPVIVSSATVKLITANGRPRTMMTTPGAAFTSTGCRRAPGRAPPSSACSSGWVSASGVMTGSGMRTARGSSRGWLPGTRLANFADFLWAFVHPGLYGDGEPAAHMLRVAADAYGLQLSGGDLVDAMLTTVRHFQAVVAPPDRGVMEWGAAELAHLERNADLFRARLSA
jgi:hypothetical protein